MATRAPTLDDVGHEWGSDLQVSPTGDLLAVSGATRSRQRILRRLMTNLRDYLWELDYGGSLPKRVGEALDLGKIRAAIVAQMSLEASVAQNPRPVVNVREIPGGVHVAVQYVALPDKQPISLTFELTE